MTSTSHQEHPDAALARDPVPPKLINTTHPWNGAPPKLIDKRRHYCSIKPIPAARGAVHVAEATAGPAPFTAVSRRPAEPVAVFGSSAGGALGGWLRRGHGVGELARGGGGLQLLTQQRAALVRVEGHTVSG
ncbi:hypothetical protein [Streptomyces sp. FXJ1.172]|uniref:hypothetical protein n=1 Tax=Streptomyces sp. FXJ1.172 TaxID=710705 RepID=UPI001331B4FF|nr:hypothetical protein [Streptomyces sp. FXJ1.172]WEO92695.1 hypothetical protein A6P39_000295 [Streptomyces sp. FXJ1.172]